MTTPEEEPAQKKFAAGMYMFAAVIFLIIGVLGSSTANVVFLVLAMALVVLSLNYWRSSNGS